MHRVKLIIKYIDMICQAIDEDEQLFRKRMDLITSGNYRSQELINLEYKISNGERKIRTLVEQASKI